MDESKAVFKLTLDDEEFSQMLLSKGTPRRTTAIMLTSTKEEREGGQYANGPLCTFG